MKILSKKTYNNLTLQLKKSESDLKKQQDKADTIQIELNNTIIELNQCKQKLMKKETELEQQIEFISALNGRVVAAEVSSEKSLQKILELESKLCRKGTGTKGSKKVYNICSCDTERLDTNIEPNDDLASTKPRYVYITSEEQLRNYIGKKFECTLKYDIYEDKISGEIILSDRQCFLCFNSNIVGWKIFAKYNINTNYKKAWGVFDCDFNNSIFNLRIIL